MRKLPFEYAVRNLGRKPLRLLLSLGGSALVVLLVLTASAFVRGMEKSLVNSGNDKNIMIMQAGSTDSVERSDMSASVPGIVRSSIPGIKNKLGMDYVSPEVHIALQIFKDENDTKESSAVIRGFTPAALLVHEQINIIDGRLPEAGKDEIMVGQLTAARMGWNPERLTPGQTVWFDNRTWTIAGQFAAAGTVMDAEIWCPITDIMIATKREGYSCVVVTLDQAELSDVEMFTASRNNLELAAISETEYYKKLVSFYKPVRLMIWVTAGLIALGGLFGGLNTMHAAFSARHREVGMLRSLGFSRRAIAISLIQESILISCCGALLACIFGMIFIDGMSVQISMGAFGLSVDSTTVAIGLISGLFLGFAGASPAIINMTKMPVTLALKAV
ncbi:MAG: FtsX-like permease family protein [Phycisphaerae bacterium]|nr:FtsX-like permease family protein [Phycisphaerae bacterium]